VKNSSPFRVGVKTIFDFRNQFFFSFPRPSFDSAQDDWEEKKANNKKLVKACEK